MQLLRSKDFVAGLVFLAIGGGALIISRNYRLGTASEMGPGYFPMMLALLLMGLGLVLAIKACRDAEGETIEPIHWRVLFFPTVAVVLFGMMLERFGLVLSLVALLAVGVFASRETRLKEVPFLIVAAVAFCVAVFIYGVELPMEVWPR
jgi:putative tricarboxylic transport membrane protein